MRMLRFLSFAKLLLIALFVSSGIFADEVKKDLQEPMIIRYVDRGPTLDARHAYKFALINKILEATKSDFGNYSIEPYKTEPGAKRQALLINQGDQINLMWASPGTVIATADVIPVPIDILRGLLGYRVCLINKDSKAPFNTVRDMESIGNIRIGQGVGWADLDVYSFNKIPIVTGSTFEGMFNMLAYNRFDCLALGADEIVYTFHEKRNKWRNLAMEKSLLLYYNYPIYLYVSSKHPEIAARIEKGLKRLQANGEFDRLFNQYFRQDLEELHLKSRRIVCLKTPYLPPAEQCQHLDQLPGLHEQQLFKAN